ncbi:hypothetical protein M9H77_22099 [Catharanthus roseus]|uniref:Uncharacterized protein n=1 Tax=Catharanthus roseus TaxID=4058 RepID=A0ACC0ATJ4_CATRO|nr:hypothetical protein M9H77_22099 [Catharanthus roseus]
MPYLFGFGACPTTVLPVWVTFLGLPLELWNGRLLEKICLRIGVPLCTDRLTSKKDKVSYARALVEIDITKKLFTEIPVKLPNGSKEERRMDATSLQKQGKQQHTEAGHDAGDSGNLGGDSEDGDDPMAPCRHRKSLDSEFLIDSGGISGDSGGEVDSGGQADDSGSIEDLGLSLGNLGAQQKAQRGATKLVGKTQGSAVESQPINKGEKGTLKRSTPILIDKQQRSWGKKIKEKCPWEKMLE